MAPAGRPKTLLELTSEEREQLGRWSMVAASEVGAVVGVAVSDRAGLRRGTDEQGSRGPGTGHPADRREMAATVRGPAVGRAVGRSSDQVVPRRSPGTGWSRSWSTRWNPYPNTPRTGHAGRWRPRPASRRP